MTWRSLIPYPWAAPEPPPTFALGPLDVFAAPEELAPHIGAIAGTDQERRAALCLLVGTRWVLFKLGYAWDEEPIPPYPEPLAVVPVEVRGSWHHAALLAAIRFWHDLGAPFGVVAGFDMATYVRWAIPDADLVLLGERQRFGIA